MVQDSFYVTLASTASLKDYPQNTQSSFTTVLPEPIELNGDYEVAMVQIMYSPVISANFGKLMIYDFFDSIFYFKYIDHCAVPFNILNGTLLTDFLKNTNSLMKQVLIYSDLKYRYTALKSKIEFKDILNHDKLASLAFHSELNNEYIINSYSKIRDLENINVFYDEVNKKYKLNKSQMDNYLTINKNIQILTLSGILEELIKIDKIQLANEISLIAQNEKFLWKAPYFSTLPTQYEFKLNNSINGNFKLQGHIATLLTAEKINEIKLNSIEIYTLARQLYMLKYALIYCDIIDYQIFGDTSAPILKVIPLYLNNNNLDLISYYDTMHYVPVSKSRINTINIKLLDIQGETIKFSDILSNTIIKLHFRAK